MVRPEFREVQALSEPARHASGWRQLRAVIAKPRAEVAHAEQLRLAQAQTAGAAVMRGRALETDGGDAVADHAASGVLHCIACISIASGVTAFSVRAATLGISGRGTP